MLRAGLASAVDRSQRREGVKARRWLLPLAAAAIIVPLVAVAASNARTGSPAKAQKTIKAGLVTDIGGLNDRSFNHLANLGRLKAQKQLKITTRVLTSSNGSEYIPNLTTLARQNY